MLFACDINILLMRNRAFLVAVVTKHTTAFRGLNKLFAVFAFVECLALVCRNLKALFVFAFWTGYICDFSHLLTQKWN
jgi:hypothetical protein